MQSIKFEEIDSYITESLISQRKSFQILGLNGVMNDAVEKIERKIESSGLTCRIYTAGRIAAAGGSLFGGITGILGVASAVGIAAHNIATFNPDYEISKHLVDNKLTVKYKKK